MNKLKLLVFTWLVGLFISNKAFGQTSVVQDSKGESALSVGNGGLVAVNTKDESISFSLGVPVPKKPAPGNHHNYVGFSAKAKAKNGVSNIIKNNEYQFDGNFGLFYFHDYTPDNGTIYQFYGSTDLLFSQFKLLDTNKSFEAQVFDKNNAGFKVTIGSNISFSCKRVPFLLGVALNGGTRNNTADLKALDVSMIQLISNPTGTQTRMVQRDKSTPYDINEYKQGLGFANFNVDFGPQLFERFQLLAHSRYSFLDGRKPQFNPALGLYLNKDGAPLKIVTGLQVQCLDYFNTANSTKTRWQRTVINLVAGFSF